MICRCCRSDGPFAEPTTSYNMEHLNKDRTKAPVMSTTMIKSDYLDKRKDPLRIHFRDVLYRNENGEPDRDGYIKVTLLLDRSGIMEKGKKVKPSHARSRIDNDRYCSATSGKQLPADMMRWFSLGLDKMEKYVTDNYIENPTRASRSEEHIDSILLTSEQATKLKTKLVKLKTSVISEVLGANGTTKELVQELNELLERFPAIRPQKRYHKASRKPDVINELIRVRQAAFGIDENLKDRLREEAENCVDVATSSRDREDELRSHSFYMFTDQAKTKKSFAEKHSLIK